MYTGYSSKRFDMFTFFAVTVIFLAASFYTLYMPASAAAGVRGGVSCALEVLLPSLFPFMFLCAFSSEYGISAALGKLFAPFTERVLRLPGEAGVTVLLSLVGGYPVGALGTAQLLRQKKIAPETARRMMCFCVNPGPAFLISAVGEGMYGSRAAGALILLSQTAASLLIGMVLALFSNDKTVRTPKDDSAAHRRSFSEAFVLSARSACSSAVSLCTLVVLFSAFSAMLFDVLSLDIASFYTVGLRSLMEVTDGCAAISRARLPIWFAALAAGWGGLCVHFQIFASIPEAKLNKAAFALSRLAVGGLSGSITYLLTRYSQLCAEVFSNVEETAAEYSSLTFTGSAALFISSIALLIFIRPTERAGGN